MFHVSSCAILRITVLSKMEVICIIVFTMILHALLSESSCVMLLLFCKSMQFNIIVVSIEVRQCWPSVRYGDNRLDGRGFGSWPCANWFFYSSFQRCTYRKTCVKQVFFFNHVPFKERKKKAKSWLKLFFVKFYIWHISTFFTFQHALHTWQAARQSPLDIKSS